MAIVKYGGGIAEFVGSIGGWTFQRNAAGSIVRTRPGQKKFPTPKQSVSRNNHIKYLQLYSILSASKKHLWNLYAELYTRDNMFGQTKKLTGQNWFESINYNLQLINQPLVTIPPTHYLPVTVPNYSVNLTDDKIEIVFDRPQYLENTSLIIRTTYPIFVTSNSINRYIRLTQIEESDPFDVIDLTSSWITTHELPYPPSPEAYNFSIFVMVQTVNKISGIASVGLIKQNFIHLPIEGINKWIIEDTFTVRAGIGIDYEIIDSTFYVF